MRELLIEEILFWSNKNKIYLNNNFLKFTYLVVIYKEYRNLLYYRLSRNGIITRLIANFVMLFLPRMESLQIYADKIGRNLYIEHGVATIISAESIGDNCWINQQVTIGYNMDNMAPIIKNGVRICAGAKVLGGITLGNNSIVAAGAVVVKDVYENNIVAGIPAKVIKDNKDHILWKSK